MKKEPLRIAIAGLGTVGSHVVQILEKQKDHLFKATGNGIEIIAICARDKNAERGFDISPYQWFDDPVKMATEAKVDAVVELIGGTTLAKDVVDAALNANKDVITANKALLAKHGNTLAELTSSKGLELRYEAAVAGGIPVIKTINEGLVGNDISAVYGILNGTSNYILTQMDKEGKTFAEALKEAQDLGYAEADPALDVNGGDAAHKLAILSSIAFSHQIDLSSIATKGIEKITLDDIKQAEAQNCVIKLIGAATLENGVVSANVQPTLVPFSSPLASIHGSTNAVLVKASEVGEILMTGPGAGGPETASAVVADIVDLAHDHELFPLNQPVKGMPEATFNKVEIGTDLPKLT